MNLLTLQDNFGQLCSLVRGKAGDISIGLILILFFLLMWQLVASDPEIR